MQESIGLLSSKLREAQTAHQDLLRNKSRLEHDLAIKGNSLDIDRVKCLNQVCSWWLVYVILGQKRDFCKPS